MKRSELSAIYFKENKERLKPFLKEERDSSTNPASFVHTTIKEKAYTKEDFVRQQFHIVLVNESSCS